MKFREATIAGAAIVALCAFLYGGCDRPYLPWVQNPWPPPGERGHGRETVEPRPEPVPQDPAEDFCVDMRDSIDAYRGYLEDETLPEHQRRNIRVLVEQYDRECS